MNLAAGLHHPDLQQTAPRSRQRVLVLRSCRPKQFQAAVQLASARNPGAEIVALSHRGHREALLTAGAHSVIEIGGQRFGLLRSSPLTWWRLRRLSLQEVVVPQMTGSPGGYGNLHRVAAVCGAGRAVIVPGEDPPIVLDQPRLLRSFVVGLWRDFLAWSDGPIGLLALAVAACFWPRKQPSGRIRPRVLHIISSMGLGGAQRQLTSLVNRTPPGRFDVSVLVIGSSDGDFSRQWFSDQRVTITYLQSWPRLLSSVLEVRRHCMAGDFDLVHAWLFFGNVIGAAGARLAGVPRVMVSVRNLSSWKRTWYRQWWFRAADVLSTRAADVVSVNAEALRADHARWACFPSRRIAVVHNGLDPSECLVAGERRRSYVREQFGLAPTSVVVGTVGRLAPEKDHQTFLRLILALKDTHPDVTAVIVGDGQLRSELEKSAIALGLAGAIKFAGERRDTLMLMAGFDAFVMTSIIEGFPNALLEAVFLGVPSLSSRVGGGPDILPEAGQTFEPGDVEGAARRTRALLDDPTMAADQARRVRARALDRFTADRMVQAWIEQYTTLLNATPSPQSTNL